MPSVASSAFAKTAAAALLALLACAWVLQAPDDPGLGAAPEANASRTSLTITTDSISAAALINTARLRNEPLRPLPPPPPQDPAKVALGEALFFDKRLSRDDSLACAGCHDLAKGGADGRAVSVGVGGAQGSVNAPSVFNAGLNLVQFWDGRAATLEEQAAGPVHNPLEMASNWAEVLPKLARDAPLRARFDAAYPGRGLSAATIVEALAAYERSLVTGGGRFDRWLQGDSGALSAQALEGYLRFKRHGCASCHNGAGVGGNMFQRFGVTGDWFDGRELKPADLGRQAVTGRAEDRHVFKVPSLRNVALTAPYFHDGSVATLDEAVALMGRHQLGRELSAEDVSLITAFLRSLNGRWQGRDLQ